MSRPGPRVLLLSYSYTGQSARVAGVMAGVFRARGFEVQSAAIEFTDPRYTKLFSRFPLRHAYLDVFRMLVPQLRRATGEIHVPEIVAEGEYDLVCLGSPTWWLTTSMPVRSFLHSDDAARLLAGTRWLGGDAGGVWQDGAHFTFAGGQLRSFLALVSYLASGETRKRHLGVRIPPSNLRPVFEEQARSFARRLAEGVAPTSSDPRDASAVTVGDAQGTRQSSWDHGGK